MKAVFDFKLTVSDANVDCRFSTKEIEEMDINLQMQILSVFRNVKTNVEKTVNRFFTINGEQTPKAADTADTAEQADAVAEENPEPEEVKDAETEADPDGNEEQQS